MCIAAAEQRPCWLAKDGNLADPPKERLGPHDACTWRRGTLEEAQAACATFQWCGGVVQDGGIFCYPSASLLKFSLRGHAEIRPLTIKSWRKTGRCANDMRDLALGSPKPPLPPPFAVAMTRCDKKEPLPEATGVWTPPYAEELPTHAPPPPPHSLAVAITTCCRLEYLAESVPYYLTHKRVHEVVITDDCNGTDVDALLPLLQSVPSLGHNLLKRKLRLVRNPTRLYVFRNKVASVAAVARSEWVAVVDSDNVMGDSYFDTLARHWSTVYDNKPDTRTIYSPATWASASSRAQQRTTDSTPLRIDADAFPRACSNEAVLLNAGNQVVHRRTALAAWRNVASSAYGHEAGKEGHESVLLNALMLSAGARLEVVPGMQYTHRRTPDSFYTTSAGIRQARGLDGKCQMVNHLTGAITDYTYGRTRPNSTAARPKPPLPPTGGASRHRRGYN